LGQRERKRRREGEEAVAKRRASGAEHEQAVAASRAEREQAVAPRRPTSAQRDEAVRAQLEPLAPGERPAVLTISVVVCLVAALALVIGLATGGIDTHREGGRLGGVISSIAILLLAAFGMWRVRYWGVLGFQTVLALNIVVMFLLLLRASSWIGVLIAVAVIVPASYLFYKLVRVLARIQMPR
jgi:hypothetical protein